MPDPEFHPGDRVRVRTGRPTIHCRAPFYLRGRSGVVTEFAGRWHDPEKLAYHRPGLPARALYRVRFDHLGPDGRPSGDEIMADIYEHWLDADPEARP